ncbi:MAG: 2-C-methyl-D-erythritol 2,4-cyclodiphosphate synthase, partial [Desulfonatronovibrio sp.]
VIPCADTVKKIKEGQVIETLVRDELALVQTPQFFHKNTLISSHRIAREKNFMVTDDASMVEKSGFTVKTVSGHESNAKITTIEDLKMISKPADTALPCTGFGYDVHRYGGPRNMVLGGIPISGAPGIYAHSDGDVLLHALIDAILGCLGKGDIGDIFPDTDPRFEGMSSMVFLSETLLLAQQEGLRIIHVDITIVAQVPRLSPFKNQIKSSLEAMMGLEAAQVNIKATTEEKLGFTGSKHGIKAMAVVSALKKHSI